MHVKTFAGILWTARTRIIKHARLDNAKQVGKTVRFDSGMDPSGVAVSRTSCESRATKVEYPVGKQPSMDVSGMLQLGRSANGIDVAISLASVHRRSIESDGNMDLRSMVKASAVRQHADDFTPDFVYQIDAQH